MTIKTNTEFLTAVLNTTTDADVRAYALAALNKTDDKNSKRRAKAQEKASAANTATLSALRAQVKAGEVLTSASVAGLLGVTSQKSTAVLRAGVKAGVLVEIDPIKGKSGKVKAYKFADASADVDADADADPDADADTDPDAVED